MFYLLWCFIELWLVLDLMQLWGLISFQIKGKIHFSSFLMFRNLRHSTSHAVKRKGFDDGICPIHSGAAKPFEAIFVSSKKNDAPDPLIVILHGGPHSVSLSSFSKSLAFLSSIGFSLLIVNYRWVKIYINFFRKSSIWDRNPNLLLCFSIWLKLTLFFFLPFHFHYAA